jgi:hypothetical protein
MTRWLPVCGRYRKLDWNRYPFLGHKVDTFFLDESSMFEEGKNEERKELIP